MRMIATFELFCEMASIRCENVYPITYRKEFLGIGKQLKREVAKARTVAMCKLLGWNVKNDDEADSAALFHYGSVIAAPRRAIVINPSFYGKAAKIAEQETNGDVPW